MSASIPGIYLHDKPTALAAEGQLLIIHKVGWCLF